MYMYWLIIHAIIFSRRDKYDQRIEKSYVEIEESGHELDEEKEREVTDESKQEPSVAS